MKSVFFVQLYCRCHKWELSLIHISSGTPWSAAGIGVKGDVIADLTEDMAAEQKARVTYDNILRLCDDPDVSDVIRFLREREVIHYQRFGEALRIATEKLDQKNVYAINPAFDK